MEYKQVEDQYVARRKATTDGGSKREGVDHYVGSYVQPAKSRGTFYIVKHNEEEVKLIV